MPGAATVGRVHRSLTRLADRQGGVLTREQALGSCSAAEVRAALRRGTWRRTSWAGVYVDGEVPDHLRLPALVRAAALWLGGDLVACGTTAALLWGFDLRTDEDAASGGLHFLGPERINNRKVKGLQVHASHLGTEDAVLRRGVWCTPPARTACEVARTGAPIDALASLDAALRSRWCSPQELSRAAEEQHGRRGVVLLRRLVPHADPRAESPMESRMRWRFLQGGLPTPDLQLQVADDGRHHRLDTGWREQRVGAEFDGLTAHMTREQLAADRARATWLAERDWRLLHFTAVDVYRRWEPMVATVRRSLERATSW